MSPSPSRPARTLLPAALIVLGVAFSSSTACITSTLISQASRDAHNARVEAQTKPQREQLERALLPALPAPGPRDTERLRIMGGPETFTVVAVGEFTPEAVRAFEAAARQVQAQLSPPANVSLSLQRESPTGRTIVAWIEIKVPPVAP